MTMKKLFTACMLLALSASAALSAPKFSVGIVQLVEHPSLDEVRLAILDELKAAGYGPDVVEIDYQNGQNSPSLISTICQKFVAHEVNVIVPIATPAAQGAAAATETIPVIFAAVSDPVAAGLVKDPAHPESNVTGVSDAIHPSNVLDLAEELTPGLKNYGIIYNTAEANSTNTAHKAEAEMTKRGIAFREAIVSTAAEVVPAVNSLMGKVDAIYVPDDNTTALAMPLLSQAAIEHKVPVYTAVDSLVHDGGLATSGINYTNLGRQAGQMIIRVLNGAKIADTPVEVLHEVSVVVNKETAAAIGVDVSKYAQ